MKRTESHHCVDYLFVLTLFVFFTITALAVIYIGLQVYRSTINRMQSNYTSATALAYVSEKLRAGDSAGSLSLTEISDETGQVPALAIRQTEDGEDCITYIYASGDQLMELFTTPDISPQAGMGQALTKVTNFTVTQQNGYFTVTLTDDLGHRLRLIFKLYSQTP